MRRRLLTVAIFLLAGAVVNVAVAWGCAIWATPRLRSSTGWLYDDDNMPCWVFMLTRGLGAARVQFISLDLPLPSWATSEFIRPDAIPSWSYISGRRPGPEDPAASALRKGAEEWDRVEDARGLPVLAMSCELKLAPFDPDREAFVMGIQGGIPIKHVYPTQNAAGAPLRATSSGAFMWVRALPLRPIWPGFAVNTFFYAALLWLLIYGATMRRFLRVRRGLCPKCAYPMGESAVCTECGNELPQRVRAVT